MKRLLIHILLTLILVFSTVSSTAQTNTSDEKWHYFAGLNASCIPAFHTDDSRIAVHVPIGAFCGAVKKYGVYMRMAMSPTINTHNIVENLSDINGYIGSPITGDGRVALKAVYNQVSVGPVFRIRNDFYIYGGLAWYQMRAFALNDNNEYVRIKDRCTRGLGFDTGAIWRYRHVFATGGISLDTANWIDSSPYSPFFSANISFGYFF